MTESLGEAFPKAIERAKTILGYYEEIGPPGAFGAATIRATIAKAEKAWRSGDLAEIVRLYQERMEIEE